MAFLELFDFPGGELAAFCAASAVCWIGYAAFQLLRLPSPALLGSMAAAGALSASGFMPRFPVWILSLITNAMIGMMLGKQINRGVFGKMRSLALPVCIQLVSMLVLSLICGWAMYALSASHGVSVTTALISGTMGGIAEMMIFGLSVDADLTVVAFMHVFRLVFFIWMLPYISIAADRFVGKKAARKSAPDSQTENNGMDGMKGIPLFDRRDYICMAVFAFACSSLANWLRIPTGAMLGAVVGSGAFTIAINKRFTFNARLAIAAQIGLGLVLGQRLTPQIVDQAGALLVSALLLSVVMLVCCVSLAALLYRTSGLDLQTCILSASPAGLNQIPIFAEDMNADAFTSSIFHTVRLMGIVSLYPWIITPFI